MPDNVLIQYGCFALVAVMVLWSVTKGIPSALRIHKETMISIAAEHKEAVGKLVDAYKDESRECREERRSTAEKFAAELEKDRVLRHNLATQYQAAISEIQRDYFRRMSGEQ